MKVQFFPGAPNMSEKSMEFNQLDGESLSPWLKTEADGSASNPFVPSDGTAPLTLVKYAYYQSKEQLAENPRQNPITYFRLNDKDIIGVDGKLNVSILSPRGVGNMELIRQLAKQVQEFKEQIQNK